ncbi:AraC family transcriptional regulator [Paenibacillaceae bacterium]|nr:AraC family transcriptional regulator [Paenibacillaceae bacterium]
MDFHRYIYCSSEIRERYEMEEINRSINHFLKQMEFNYCTTNQMEKVKSRDLSNEGFVMRLHPRSDMMMTITNCILADNKLINIDFEGEMVEWMICFQGEGEVQANGVQGTLKRNTMTLGLMNGVKGEYFFKGEEPIMTMSLHTSAATFDRYLTRLDGTRSADFEQLIGGRSLLQFQKSILDTPILHLISELVYTPFTNSIRMIALESLALELISYGLNCFVYDDSHRGNQEPDITISELQSLQYAKEVLMHRIDNPPSLLELSRIIGMNDYKLKRYFKAVFGTTVFGHLRDIRMEKAMALLQDGRTTVSAVAANVGYLNVSYFASAFRKRYGLNPSEILHYTK